MKMLKRLLLIGLAIPLTACGMFTQYAKEDCAMLSGRDALKCMDYRQRQVNADLSREASELLRAYRQCVHKHEGDAGKAKENCAMYRDVLQNIQLGHMSCT
jgi:hypothetical protein